VYENHTKINMNNSLEPLCTLDPIGTCIVQYSVYIKLCEYNHIFTLNVSDSGEFGGAKKI